ncbi:hypothetical protein HS960_05350 [Sphingobacterium paramultivorum]|uniref:Uncharacterized protein n=1 Tax=Sphingobacterium paramultivorum TaxID=2886510 RepID=A0A7G5DZE1_9SPHI|nr:hypothetical protein [Sphingobacterium paramultivorum]QMV67116.1 hypothetical protein HS960_05350 [Sphingobacterium paramultivorum]WSO15961.1 hypothetical protein VUL84_05320 [Sphingobacterium paramultivorum]
MIILIIRKVLNDYVAFINDFKHQFSTKMGEFEKKAGIVRDILVGSITSFTARDAV